MTTFSLGTVLCLIIKTLKIKLALVSANPADWGIPHDVYVTTLQYSNKTACFCLEGILLNQPGSHIQTRVDRPASQAPSCPKHSRHAGGAV